MDQHPSQEGLVTDQIVASTHEYDRDLLELLPALETIDALVIYYFEYCNWINRHVNQQQPKRVTERLLSRSSLSRNRLHDHSHCSTSLTRSGPSHRPPRRWPRRNWEDDFTTSCALHSIDIMQSPEGVPSNSSSASLSAATISH